LSEQRATLVAGGQAPGHRLTATSDENGNRVSDDPPAGDAWTAVGMTLGQMLEGARYDGAYATRAQAEQAVRAVLAALGRHSPSPPAKTWSPHPMRLQGKLGEGPCFDLARRKDGARVYRIADMTQPRPAWERFAAGAGELGVGSMTGVLLYTDNDDFGALNLYSSRRGAFGEEIETAGWLPASHAAVAVAGARTIDQLQHGMETRHAIGEAVGILMERHGLSEDDAFGVLRQISQNHDVTLRDVAQKVRAERTDPV
jgi:hypothetical protein